MTRARSWLVLTLVFALGTALLSAAERQGPGARRGPRRTRGSFLGLVSMEPVQKDLKLSEEQMGKLKGIGEKLRAEMKEQFAAVREIEDPQKRRAKMTELSDQLDAKAREQLRDVLSREQMRRLYGIRLQVRGAVYALNSERIAARLKLTDEQKNKAAELDKATQEKISEVYGALGKLSEEERRAKFAEAREKVGKIRAEAEEKALAMLTAEQKEAFEKMQGEKLEL